MCHLSLAWLGLGWSDLTEGVLDQLVVVFRGQILLDELRGNHE